MATRAMNFKMDEADVLDMKRVAGVFNMSVTDLIKNAVKEYRQTQKRSLLSSDSKCGRCVRRGVR